MNANNIGDIYPLSPMQQGMLFHILHAPKSGVYFEQIVYALQGDLNVSAFKRAWQQVIERHPILRTLFLWKRRNEPLQVVRQQVKLPWTQQDWRGQSPVEQQQRFEIFLQADRDSGFEFSQTPPMRLTLIRVSADTYRFIWSFYHLLLDRWSFSLVLKEVFAFYRAFDRGQDLHLETSHPYRDYIAWLRRQDLSQAELFWRRFLKDFTAPTVLGIDQAPTSLSGQEIIHDKQQVRLSAATTTALQSLARQHRLTLNTLVQGAWALLLSRYSGEEDVVFGVTVSGRSADLVGVESMVGLFINTLPVRVQMSPDDLLLPWLKQLQNRMIELLQYEYSSLVEIQGWSEVPRTLPLFESILVVENIPVDVSFLEPDKNLEIRKVHSYGGRTNYPLTVLALPEQELLLGITCDSSRFDVPTINRTLRHFQNLLEGIAAAGEDQRLSDLPLLTKAEQHQLLVEWNDTQANYPEDLGIHQLFEAQVERTPDAVAVVFQNEQLTYHELNCRANRVAHYLQTLDVGPEALVAICVERSLEMVIGLLGILKAGGAYLPLDPAYPRERLQFMIGDSGAGLILTQKRLVSLVKSLAGTRFVLLDGDDRFLEDVAGDMSSNLRRGSSCPDNLAYVIYTSGSTGLPKGVAVEHRSVVNMISFRTANLFNKEDLSVVPFQLSIAFDGSVSQLFVPLSVGSKIIIAENSLAWHAHPQVDEITCVNLVPAALEVLLNEYGLPRSLRTVGVGAEAISQKLMQALRNHAQVQKIINVYGPTEATVNCSAAVLFDRTLAERRNNPDDGGTAAELPVRQLITIGKPIQNMQIYLLDKHLQPVPIGVPGELHIGGVGLARGYLNHPELTAEKFIPNPFWRNDELGMTAQGDESNEGSSAHHSSLITHHFIGTRLYKTGDLARYRPDGNIELLGRIDHQVKIRGFRIEPGEVETVLTQHPTVQEAVVEAREAERESGDKRLVAYLVLAQTPGPTIDELRSFLREKLPDYMVPTAFVTLERLPLTPSGKVDRQALPLPGQKRPELARNFVRPRTPVEEMLASIWAEILGLEQVGIHDNFFELGGHSLLAIRIISRLHDAFQVELPLRCIFESPTVAKLAELIEQARDRAPELRTPTITPVPRKAYRMKRSSAGELIPVKKDSYGNGVMSLQSQELMTANDKVFDDAVEDVFVFPTSFAQQRLWFLDQLGPSRAVYNIPAAIRLTGPLNVTALEQSLNEILQRHEALRTTFSVVEGEPVQVIAPTRTLTLPVVDLQDLAETEREAETRRLVTEEARRPFDLAQGSLFRATLLRLSPEEHVLLLTMHHIISDGWSMPVLFRELSVLYEARSTGQPSPLPDLPIQYADFAVWQREWLQGDVLETQLTYWKKQLDGAPPCLELPLDHPRPAVRTYRGTGQSLLLPKALSEALKTLSQQEEVTLFMTLLTAFETLLYRYTGQTDIVVGSPIANRKWVELEGLIGFFVNTLTLRVDLSGNPTFRDLLVRVREVVLGAYTHQELPFEKLVEELQPERDPSRPPLFQMMFVFQNMPGEILQLPGLTVKRLKVDNKTTKFDLTLFIVEETAGLRATLRYNTDLFEAATVKRMLGHFQILLEGIVSDPDQRLSDFPLLTEAEWHQLLVEWNDTRKDYPQTQRQCVHQLFEAQVERTPDRIAAVCEDRRLTYQELNQKANQLALLLREKGIGQGTYVAVLMDRGLDLLISYLAIMKAGAAFVPMDSNWPAERIKEVIRKLNSEVVLVGKTQPHRETLSKRTCLVVDERQLTGSRSNLNVPMNSEEPIYVIFTSGSTGKPKGAINQHQGFANRFCNMSDRYDYCEEDVFLVTSPHIFDVSIWQLLLPLVNGARTVIPSPTFSFDLQHMIGLIEKEQVTITGFVPSVFNILVDHLANNSESPHQLSSLRHLVIGGEAINPKAIYRFKSYFPDMEIVNGYGPAETSIGVIYYEVPNDHTSQIPIGRPLHNVYALILDENLNPVPVGVPGELYIGGICVGLGYLNDEPATRSAFIQNSFQEIDCRRLYKTGDLARFLPDGNIDFLGRIDYQVKIGGIRVEPGEIESILGQHPGVKEKVVLAREDIPGDKRLVAYVVANQEVAPTSSELRSFLRHKLPEYMVPSAFMMLDVLPLTPNGKIDRQALPPPDRGRPEPEKALIAPRDNLELELTQIWERVLDIQPIGVKDDFFELGGHSLLAVRLFAEIEQRLGKKLPLVTLFQTRTIEQLAPIIRQEGWTPPWRSLVPIQPEGSKPPFFCVHALGGHILVFHDLARQLGPEQPFYGFQAIGLDGEEEPHTKVEDMAADYIKEMRNLQPEGPYFLGGYCTGGKIAFEMAQQLQRQGQQVALLALIDASGNFRTILSQVSLFKRIRLHVWNLTQLEPTEKLTYMRTYLRWKMLKTKKAVRSRFQQWLDKRRPGHRGTISRDLHRALLLKGMYQDYPKHGLSLPQADRHVRNVHQVAMKFYAPQVYPDRITLFAPGKKRQRLHLDPRLGWGRLATGGLVIHEVTGDHFTLPTEPNLRVLAEKLRGCLDEVQAMRAGEQT